MTDEDVIARVAVLLGVKYHKRIAARSDWTDSYMVRLKGRRAVGLMVQLRPLMGSRRQGQIDRAIASYENGRLALTFEQAEEIRCRLLTEPAATLATEFGVGKATVYYCGRGQHASQVVQALAVS